MVSRNTLMATISHQTTSQQGELFTIETETDALIPVEDRACDVASHCPQALDKRMHLIETGPVDAGLRSRRF